jgi:ethanolamine utilization microcompartment shell protein EutL
VIVGITAAMVVAPPAVAESAADAHLRPASVNYIV